MKTPLADPIIVEVPHQLPAKVFSWYGELDGYLDAATESKDDFNWGRLYPEDILERISEAKEEGEKNFIEDEILTLLEKRGVETPDGIHLELLHEQFPDGILDNWEQGEIKEFSQSAWDEVRLDYAFQDLNYGTVISTAEELSQAIYAGSGMVSHQGTKVNIMLREEAEKQISDLWDDWGSPNFTAEDKVAKMKLMTLCPEETWKVIWRWAESVDLDNVSEWSESEADRIWYCYFTACAGSRPPIKGLLTPERLAAEIADEFGIEIDLPERVSQGGVKP